MSQKQIKKQRQFLRRQYSKDMRDIAEANMKFLKTKPRFIPMFIWISLLKIFIKIK